MKLEVGMYVRTKKSEIAKAVSNGSYWINIDKFKKDGMTLRTIRKIDISKASNNIIDLIEVGDYVNGCKVVNINYDLNYDEDIVESITIFDYSIEGNDILHNEDIKSIVTKEQFESMKYSLEG